MTKRNFANIDDILNPEDATVTKKNQMDIGFILNDEPKFFSTSLSSGTLINAPLPDQIKAIKDIAHIRDGAIELEKKQKEKNFKKIREDSAPPKLSKQEKRQKDREQHLEELKNSMNILIEKKPESAIDPEILSDQIRNRSGIKSTEVSTINRSTRGINK